MKLSRVVQSSVRSQHMLNMGWWAAAPFCPCDGWLLVIRTICKALPLRITVLWSTISPAYIDRYLPYLPWHCCVETDYLTMCFMERMIFWQLQRATELDNIVPVNLPISGNFWKGWWRIYLSELLPQCTHTRGWRIKEICGMHAPNWKFDTVRPQQWHPMGSGQLCISFCSCSKTKLGRGRHEHFKETNELYR